ncbi:MAG: hypothetical protein ACRDMH_13080 [Solirubrobacterales bacterium]
MSGAQALDEARQSSAGRNGPCAFGSDERRWIPVLHERDRQRLGRSNARQNLENDVDQDDLEVELIAWHNSRR